MANIKSLVLFYGISSTCSFLKFCFLAATPDCHKNMWSLTIKLSPYSVILITFLSGLLRVPHAHPLVRGKKENK